MKFSKRKRWGVVDEKKIVLLLKKELNCNFSSHHKGIIKKCLLKKYCWILN